MGGGGGGGGKKMNTNMKDVINQNLPVHSVRRTHAYSVYVTQLCIHLKAHNQQIGQYNVWQIHIIYYY